ncbi:hypothetical protein [Nocardioides sp. GXQ0305]|jgi:hypothetical protein|uniref:hypothetical protein n=1 Tax=Nocardioides sp. GXQ0305 TaxID=3423912 RepID=UPI003D7F156C
MRTTRTVVTLAAAALIVVVTAGVATAAWLMTRDDAATVDRGDCAGATYELSAEPDDGGHEVSFELRSSGPGETWQVTVEQDGTPLLDAERTTDDEGEIDVDVMAAPEADPEVTVSASRGDQLCRASTRW